MIIETTRGPLDDSTLVRSEGVIDDADRYQRWVEYRAHGETEAIYRSENGFAKVNPFLAPRGTITVDFGNGFEEADEDTFAKSVSVVDNEHEFTCVVECRRKEDGMLVHRSANVHLKQGVEATSAVGGVG